MISLTKLNFEIYFSAHIAKWILHILENVLSEKKPNATE